MDELDKILATTKAQAAAGTERIAFEPMALAHAIETGLAARLAAERERPAIAVPWVRSADRLPMPNESPGGYFWGWDESTPNDAPTLLEAWDRDGKPMGFCHEACGIVSGISHWMPAIPPDGPN